MSSEFKNSDIDRIRYRDY